jgi:hypothetical protein
VTTKERKFLVIEEMARRVYDVRDEFIAAGELPTDERVRAILRERYDDLRDDERCLDLLAAQVQYQVDKEQTAEAKEERPGLNPGGTLRLNENDRVLKPFATLDELERAIAFDEREAVAEGREPSRQLRKELDLLRPYWTAGAAMSEAVASYEQARGRRE